MTTQNKSSPRYSSEVRERAVWMVLDHTGEYPSQWAAICSIPGKIGCATQMLANRVRRSERGAGLRPGLTSEERVRIKELERENRELRQANEIAQNISLFCSLSAMLCIACRAVRRSSSAGRRHDPVH